MVLLSREQKAMLRIWRCHLLSWLRETPLAEGAICWCDKGQKPICFLPLAIIKFSLAGFSNYDDERITFCICSMKSGPKTWVKMCAFVHQSANKPSKINITTLFSGRFLCEIDRRLRFWSAFKLVSIPSCPNCDILRLLWHFDVKKLTFCVQQLKFMAFKQLPFHQNTIIWGS